MGALLASHKTDWTALSLPEREGNITFDPNLNPAPLNLACKETAANQCLAASVKGQQPSSSHSVLLPQSQLNAGKGSEV